MTTQAMKYIEDLMQSIGIPYDFMTWQASTIPERYYVGEYTEVESPYEEESGYQETSFMLTGFTNSAWSLLENDKAAIKKVLPKQVIFPDGSACAVLYANAFPIRQDNISLKRIQINLTIKEWKVN